MENIFNFSKNVFQNLKQEYNNHPSLLFVLLSLLCIPLGYAFNSISLALLIISTLINFKKVNFSFLHINAMSLTNLNLVYIIIYESITGRRVAPASAALFLDEFFKKKDKTKLLNMEINKGPIKSWQEVALVTKKQTLLYNLFDWPCHQNSKLLVISISNTNLPERMLVKINSRIGNNRLVYEP